MKAILVSLVLVCFLFSPISSYSQSDVTKKIKQYTVRVPSNVATWTLTGIKVGKGDFVIFESADKINLGKLTTNISAGGSINPFLLIWNRYPAPKHGNLICANNNKLIHAMSEMPAGQLAARNHIGIPSAVVGDKRKPFVGNGFYSESDQELKLIVNDSLYEDNSGEFVVKIRVLSIAPSPKLHAKFDFAHYIDSSNGKVPFCMENDCIPKYFNPEISSDRLWFDGSDDDGHFYLAINPLGYFNADLSVAMNLLKNNIYNIFPGYAVDKESRLNPAASTIQLDHEYELITPPVLPKVKAIEVSNYHLAEVKAIEVSNYHFTFLALGVHVLKGTAVHGLFKDSCGKLYMFQQGRGIPEEVWWKIDETNINPQGFGNQIVAEQMWQLMAHNFKAIL